MASEWHTDSLASLIDVKHGFAFAGDKIYEEPRGDVLLTPGNFEIGGGFKGDKFKYYDGPVPDEYVLDEGDLIITMTDLSKQADTLGFPAFVPIARDGRRFLHNQRIGKVVLRHPESLVTKYLYYVMCGQEYRHEVLASATGTTVKHTSPDRIRRFRFSCAPLAEQRAIAHILGTLDDKIELNRRMNETLEAMARALFKSWFVDFEPVRAKMDGRWRKGQSLPGLPAHLYDLFPNRLVDSELGEIPEGWALGTVGDLCTAIFSGGTPRTELSEYWGGDIPWLSSGETRDAFIVDTERRITVAGVSNSSTRLAKAFSTVIASAGQGNTRGQTSLIGFDTYINQSVVALRASLAYSSPFHLYFDLERRYEEFRRISDAHSSRGSLTTKLIAQVPAIISSRSIIEVFDKIVDPQVSRIFSFKHESRTLANLRETLLPKLISGELRLKAAERIVAKSL
ncbi:MAG: restriction endonuclease subunit S [Candidatus Hydrogenedentes bacterium]|nr:restriction endonuclease subunit S [Candidatus Hydrogenedentota bacterium]